MPHNNYYMEGRFNIEARTKYLPSVSFSKAEASKAKAAKWIAPWAADDFLDWAAIHPSLWTSSVKFLHDLLTCSSHVPSLNAVHPTAAKIIDIEALLNWYTFNLAFLIWNGSWNTWSNLRSRGRCCKRRSKNATNFRKSQSKMACINEN